MSEIATQIKEAEDRMLNAEKLLTAVGFPETQWTLIREYVTAAIIRAVWIQAKSKSKETE